MIEVHHCCYLGGILGGLSAGRVEGKLFFQLCMRSWTNGEEACYIDGGAYLEEGFRGGML